MPTCQPFPKFLCSLFCFPVVWAEYSVPGLTYNSHGQVSQIWLDIPPKGDNYYYGADELFKYQPNIADNILREAPFLAESLLEAWVCLRCFLFSQWTIHHYLGNTWGNNGEYVFFFWKPFSNSKEGLIWRSHKSQETCLEGKLPINQQLT